MSIDDKQKYNRLFNQVTQFLLPFLTLSGQFIIAIGYPKWGFSINLLAQPFWIYSSWKAYKKAGQIGLLLTTLAITLIVFVGVINYWFLNK